MNLNPLENYINYVIDGNIEKELIVAIADNVREDISKVIKREFIKIKDIHDKLSWMQQYLTSIILSLDLPEEYINSLSKSDWCSPGELIQVILKKDTDELISYINKYEGNCCIQTINDL